MTLLHPCGEYSLEVSETLYACLLLSNIYCVYGCDMINTLNALLHAHESCYMTLIEVHEMCGRDRGEMREGEGGRERGKKRERECENVPHLRNMSLLNFKSTV